MGGTFSDGDDIKVKGVDETGADQLIAAEQDEGGKWRLLVAAKSTIEVIQSPHHFVLPLLSGASRQQAVNGSVTPVVYQAGPANGIKWYVYQIELMLSDLKVDTRVKFGDLTGLTNGFLCESLLNATARQIFNISNNQELAVTFDYQFSSKSDSALANEDALFVGTLGFNNVIVLNGTTGDKIRTTVRDNLSGLDSLQLAIKAYEIT